MSADNRTGRVAVITGASSGIGEATARALAADGYRVALLARRLDRIQALAEELGDGAIAIQADVTDRDSLVAAAQRVQDELGGADILVNNAGVMLLGPFSAELSDDYRRMIETNLLGAITTTEVFLDQLLADDGGDLVNLSSVAGRTARPGNAVYAATKWGMNGWSESLRQQLQPGVRVIVIEPGAVATELPEHITHGETRSAVEQMYEATRSALRTSPRSSPSPSRGPAACRSTRSSSARPRRRGERTPATPDTRGTNPTMTPDPGTEQRRHDARPRASASSRHPPTRPEMPSGAALDAGYRHIDTAAAYGNERQVGEAVHSSDLDRSDVFLETKVWISDYGYDETLHAFEKSARKLGVEQIDLLILHQALPSAFDRTLEAYRALETLLADGKVRAIGVSNFMVEHLTRLLDRATVVPAVNQIECHPYFQQQDVQDFGAEHGILPQAWSPIGGITFYRDGSHGSTLEDPVIADIATAHGKTPAQVMLRWGLQHGRSVIPKSTKPSRIAENINVFDFELSADEMAAIDGLDTGRRGGPEPDAITLEAFGREIPEA